MIKLVIILLTTSHLSICSEIYADDLNDAVDIGEHPEADPCVPLCFQTKPDAELELFFGNLGHPMQIKYIHKILVPRLLTKYCEHVNETWSCMARCQDSRLKSIFAKAFSPLSYMCIESAFVEHAACYKKVYDRLELPCCNNPRKCGGLKIKVERNFRGGQKLDNETNRQYAEKVVSSICDYADCANRCRRPLIEQTCGQMASRTLNKWYSKMVEALTESQVFFGFNMKVPKNCLHIGKESQS